MSEPAYTAGYWVTLRLPDHITPEQAERELRTCISFGQAKVSLAYVLPDAPPEHGPETDGDGSVRPEVELPGILR